MSTLFIAGLFLLAIAVVVALFVFSAKAEAKKTRMKLAERFTNLVDRHQFTVSEKEVFIFKILAFDATDKQFLFVGRYHNAEQAYLLPLADISNCQVVKHKSGLSGGKNDKHIDTNYVNSIELQVRYKDKSKDPVAVTFYEHTHDSVYDMKSLEEQATYWQQKIVGQL
jgi:hypothetical protein